MRTRAKKKRKDSSLWNRRINTVPLTERGAFQIPEAADYMSRSITVLRRLIKGGQLHGFQAFETSSLRKPSATGFCASRPIWRKSLRNECREKRQRHLRGSA